MWAQRRIYANVLLQTSRREKFHVSSPERYLAVMNLFSTMVLFMTCDFLMTPTKIKAERRRSFSIGMLTSDLTSSPQDPVGSAMFDKLKSFERTSLQEEFLQAISSSIKLFKNSSVDSQGNASISDNNFSSVSLRYLPLSSKCDGAELIKVATKHHGEFDIFLIGEYSEMCHESNAHELRGKKYELFCNAVDIIATLWNIPCLSWSCIPAAGSFYEKPNKISPYSHIKFFPDIGPTIQALFSVLEHMGWYHIGLLSFMEDEPWITFCNDVEEGILLKQNFTLQYYRTISLSSTATESSVFYADKIITQLEEFAKSDSKGMFESVFLILPPLSGDAFTPQSALTPTGIKIAFGFLSLIYEAVDMS